MQHGVERTPSPEGHATPPGDYQSWDAYMRDVEQAHDLTSSDRFALAAGESDAKRRADHEANTDISEAITKAMRLAPNTLVFRALLEGQEVPVSALDPAWAHRYGLRRAA